MQQDRMREFFLYVGDHNNVWLHKLVRFRVESTVCRTYDEEHGRRGDGRRRSLSTRSASSSRLAQVAVLIYPSS